MSAMDETPRSEPSRGPDGVVAVYLTFPNETSALDVSRALVERRLVACVNVLPGATSVFRWDGEVVREREVVAVAKTTRGAVARVCEAVGTLHPYEVPCVVAYPAEGGLDAYVDWVRGEVGDAAAG